MRKTTIVTIVVLAVAGVVVFFALAGPVSSDARLVRELSLEFMEDLQFKDFRRSSSYHHPLEKDRVDIGQTLEKLFLIKPESLDIQSFKIIKSDVDDTGDRARVHIRTRVHRLNMKDEPEDGEMILYWMKRNPDCPIGAACKDSSCVNEGGEALWFEDESTRPIPDSEAERARAEAERRKKPPPRKLTCDPTREDRWFMNLDSTLKEKRYNY